MTKWKLVPVDCWRELEPYLGKDVPNREVVLLSDVKGALASAPPAPKLSDERILELFDEHSTPDRWPFGFARAIGAAMREKGQS